MVFFTSPNAFRNGQALPPSLNLQLSSGDLLSPQSSASIMQGPLAMLKHQPAPPHSSHPAFPHLLLLVFEAVLEVVCVSAPGYIVARQGMFDAEMQKFAANLNVMLFTPCLSKSGTIAIQNAVAKTVSLHEACFTIDSGQARRTRNYTGNLRRPDVDLVFLRHPCVKSLQI